MEKDIADMTFGVNKKAIVIANLLNTWSLEDVLTDKINYDYDKIKENIKFVSVRTSPFYNFRSSGICLTVNANFLKEKNNLVITFGKADDSDAIVVSSWEMDDIFNPPTSGDIPEEEGLLNVRKFRHDGYTEAKVYIENTIAKYVERRLEELDVNNKSKSRKIKHNL